jgi:uncharacterized protein (TIGR02996 family)
MNEKDLRWAAVVAAPADDTVRLAFADELQEAGFERMAELMRGPQGRAWVHIAAGVPMENRLLRLQFMSEEDCEGELTALINDGIEDIFHDGPAADEIAGTDAAAWAVDPDIDIQTVRFDAEGCHVHFAFRASGEEHEDAVYSGDALSGEADALIDPNGEVTREVTRAEIEDYSVGGSAGGEEGE